MDFPARGIRAVDGVDLEVRAGEQVVLLGRSGAGKTTLLRALLGGVPAATGSVRIGGRNPWGSPAEVRALRRSTGVIRQGNDLVLGVSARLNALMGTASQWRLRDWVTALRGRVPAAYAERLAALADHHGIADALDARVHELSGGQRQRVALCRALLPGPTLLLADEPTSGLDPAAAQTVVAALRATEGVTLVVATHDLGVARAFPRTVALREGAVVYDGPDFDARIAERVYGVPA
ncbi:MAG TPA: ATP-binding cassette domain-containing protein [Egibacteraceae bacterium]|nr:ATP-binding cassette domain-containing protein [Egibacteraceae bacterium]